MNPSWLGKLFDARPKLALFVSLGVLWAIVLLLVSPRGDFPLNDDWVYFRSVESILENGSYTPHPFAQSLFVGQAYWGALWAGVFGFNFTVLRFSTLALAFVGAWFTALTTAKSGARPVASLIAGATLMLSPLYLNLAYTFMGDVPFTAMTAVSIYCYTNACLQLHRQDARWMLCGTLAACAAFLVRQFGILPSISFLSIYLLYCWTNPGKLTWYAIASLFMPWVVVILAVSSLKIMASEAGQQIDWDLLGEGPVEIAANAMQWLIVALIYLSLFGLPLLLGVALASGKQIRTWSNRQVTFGLLLFCTVVYFVITNRPDRMPFLSNVLYDLGVGPLTLSGLWETREIYRPVRWNDWWWIPTVLGMFGAGLWILNAAPNIRLIRVERKSLDASKYCELFLSATVLIFVIALFNPWMQLRFDRYLLPALPAFLALLGVWSTPVLKKKAAAWLIGAVLIVFAFFSVASLQDYMAWNRARWNALEYLMTDRKIPAEEIDGGYEFNGLHTSGQYIDELGSVAFAQQGPIGHWVVKDTFAVSFTEREDFEVIARTPYYSWLGFEDRTIYTLRRIRESEWPRR